MILNLQVFYNRLNIINWSKAKRMEAQKARLCLEILLVDIACRSIVSISPWYHNDSWVTGLSIENMHGLSRIKADRITESTCNCEREDELGITKRVYSLKASLTLDI